MANEENPFPHKVDVHQKVCKPGGSPSKGAGADDYPSHLASAKARATGDFCTPRTQEHMAMFAVAYRTLVTRMFISLGLNNKIINAVVKEQGYNTTKASNNLSLTSANLLE